LDTQLLLHIAEPLRALRQHILCRGKAALQLQYVCSSLAVEHCAPPRHSAAAVAAADAGAIHLLLEHLRLALLDPQAFLGLL